MIVGIGSDIIKIQRIADSLERLGERFARRILSVEELVNVKGIGDKKLSKLSASLVVAKPE